MLRSMQAALTRRLPALVLAILVVQPPLDVLSYFLSRSGSNLFSTVLRFFMLALVGLLGLLITQRKKLYFALYAAMAGFWVLHAANCFRVGYISFYQDTANYLRILTLPVFLLSFITFFRQGGDRIRRPIGIGFTVNVGLSLLFTALPWGLAALGVGEPIYTYEKLYVGVMGWFAIPNAQSCVIILITPIALLSAYRMGKPWAFLLCCGACFGLMFVTGTKLTFYSLFLIPLAFLLVFLIRPGRKKALPYMAILLLVVVLGAVFRDVSPMQIRENMSDYSQGIYNNLVEESLQKNGASQETIRTIREGKVEKLDEDDEDSARMLAQVRKGLMSIYTDPELYGKFLRDLNDRFGIYNVMIAYHYSADSALLSDTRLLKTNYARLVWEECDLPTKLLGFEYSQMLYEDRVYDLENDFPAVYYNCGYLGFGLYLCLFLYVAFILLRALYGSVRDQVRARPPAEGETPLRQRLGTLRAVWKGFQSFLTVEMGAVGMTVVLALGAAQISGYVLRRPNVAIYLAVAAAYLCRLSSFTKGEDKEESLSEKKIDKAGKRV